LEDFKAEMEKAKLGKIVVDTREATKKGSLVEKLREKAEVAIDTLEAGDYFVVPSGFLVERKTVLDFVHSVRDGRLWGELKKMKDSNAVPLLLMEGPLSLLQKFTKWNPSSVSSLVISVEVDWGVPVVWAPNASWTVTYLFSLLRRAKERDRSYPLRVVKKDVPLWLLQRDILSGFPHISSVKAEAMLREFGSLRRVFNASEPELRRVEGVGEVIAKELIKILDTPFKRSK